MPSARVNIDGYVSKDPELRTVGDRVVTSVSVPFTPRRKNKQSGEYEDSGPTVWFEATFWNEDAQEIVSQVRKGTLVHLKGDVGLDVYEGKNGPQAKVKLGFPVLSVVVKGRRGSAPAAPAGESWNAAPAGDAWGQAEPQWNAPGASDDTPF